MSSVHKLQEMVSGNLDYPNGWRDLKKGFSGLSDDQLTKTCDSLWKELVKTGYSDPTDIEWQVKNEIQQGIPIKNTLLIKLYVLMEQLVHEIGTNIQRSLPLTAGGASTSPLWFGKESEKKYQAQVMDLVNKAIR